MTILSFVLQDIQKGAPEYSGLMFNWYNIEIAGGTPTMEVVGKRF